MGTAGAAAGDLLPSAPDCPFCGGRDTELMSSFGSKLSVATYWCRSCRTGFEYVKWGAAPDAGGRQV